LKPYDVDAAALLDSMTPDLRRVLGPEMSLVVRADVRPAFVHVDRGQFEQAILSLAERALDAMPGGGTLTITIARSEATTAPAGPPEAHPATSHPGPMIVLTVADTGHRMAIEREDQAFEPYALGDDGEQVGGLGLAMIHGFVAQSGGEVELRSVSGSGTSVEIRLPEVSEPALRDPDGSARPSDGDEAMEPVGGDETILVVDDEPAVAEFCRRVLSDLGYRVITAVDGRAAVEVAAGHAGRIDLILSDVIMTGMWGPEVVATIRASHPEAAALFASGFTADAITERGVLPDGIGLIEKPFTAASLAAGVRAELQRAASAAGSTGSS